MQQLILPFFSYNLYKINRSTHRVSISDNRIIKIDNKYLNGELIKIKVNR